MHTSRPSLHTLHGNPSGCDSEDDLLADLLVNGDFGGFVYANWHRQPYLGVGQRLQAADESHNDRLVVGASTTVTLVKLSRPLWQSD